MCVKRVQFRIENLYYHLTLYNRAATVSTPNMY
jgi:hypothetical protein